MPRDSSGNYTLPAGNPVVTGSTISSSWANTTLTDIGSELTDSLDRSGKGAMLAVLKIVDGSVSTPGLAFGSEPGTGFYRPSSAILALTITGNQIVTVSTTAAQIFVPTTITIADNQAVNIRGANSSRGYNLTFFDTTASAYRGFIGIGIATITGMAATDFGIAAGAGGSLVIGTANGGAIATRFGPNGAVTINIPTAVTQALSVFGAAGTQAAQIIGNGTTSQSYGLIIQAGTNSSDYATVIQNRSGTLNYFEVRGDGIVYGNDGANIFELGYKDTPLNTPGGSYTLVASDRGKTINISGSTTITIPNGVFAAGAVISFLLSSGTCTLAQGAGMTLLWAGNGGASGSRTLTGAGLATVVYQAAAQALISGAGLS